MSDTAKRFKILMEYNTNTCEKCIHVRTSVMKDNNIALLCTAGDFVTTDMSFCNNFTKNTET